MNAADGQAEDWIQYGALPYRFTASGRIEVLLVTSRRTRRWVIPKGWPMKGRGPAQTAAQEALEEAGLRGTIARKSIGSFVYDKVFEGEGRAVACKVKVYPLAVSRELKTWPEQLERDRRWVDEAGAAALVGDPGLLDIVLAFIRSEGAGARPPKGKPGA